MKAEGTIIPDGQQQKSCALLSRYKTTVSSAREKVSIVRTETDMARFDWLLLTYK